MKRLAILRHAKSSWGDPQLDDFDRPLNQRGRRAARRLGRELKRKGLAFDLVLASPAERVRETLDGVQETYDLAAAVRFDRSIYLASADDLLSLVKSLAEGVGSPLLVGHNPGLEHLLLELSRDDSKGLRKRVAAKYPTGALAIVELPIERWSDLTSGSGEIVELILPKDLD